MRRLKGYRRSASTVYTNADHVDVSIHDPGLDSLRFLAAVRLTTECVVLRQELGVQVVIEGFILMVFTRSQRGLTRTCFKFLFCLGGLVGSPILLTRYRRYPDSRDPPVPCQRC